MKNTEELSKIRIQIIDNVKAAAQEGNVNSISKWSKAAEQCESLIEEVTDLSNRIQEFRASILNGGNSNVALGYPNIPGGLRSDKSISAKQEGAQIRADWVKALASNGIVLNGHGKKYRTERGKSVGVASANELNKPHLIDKWFLGLKDEGVDIVVLLCRDLKKNVHDIVLPVFTLGNAWSKLSRSGGQIKFNVRRRNGDFFLLIPGDNPIKVSTYIGNYQPLEN